MKSKTLPFILLLVTQLSFAQTQYRDDAGLRGDAGAVSGFFESNIPVNFPSVATSWWHLLDVRHSNHVNNYAMQFSGSFFDQDLYFRKTNDNAAQGWSRILLETDGRVGIGTNNPQANLEIYNDDNSTVNPLLSIRSNFHTVGNYGMIRFGDFTQTTNHQKGAIIFESVSGAARGKFHIALENTDGSNSVSIADSKLTVLPDGNVGIGTTIPNERLSVNGKIRAKEIKVEANNWPDYVFDQDYKLTELQDLDAYIKLNKHLPEMPTAADVAKNGVELGEMNKLLLKKVEELTLHLIEKEKQFLEQCEINKRFEERLLKIETTQKTNKLR